jgi:hypothetical protein
MDRQKVIVAIGAGLVIEIAGPALAGEPVARPDPTHERSHPHGEERPWEQPVGNLSQTPMVTTAASASRQPPPTVVFKINLQPKE